MTVMKRGLRLLILVAAASAVAVAAALHEPIPQDAAYHSFADRRAVMGVPNFWNVASNAPFLVAGLLGLRSLRRAGGPMAAAWSLMFAGMALVAFGSAFYHLAPDHRRLTWDRLPMAVVFTSFLAVVIGEWIDPRLGRRCLPPLVAAGLLSVVHWHLSEGRGQGDLRPYVVVQFAPLLLIPLVVFMFPPGAVKPRYVWSALSAYAVAKVLEVTDGSIFQLTGVVSGHTLKHLAAAAGGFALVFGMRKAGEPSS